MKIELTINDKPVELSEETIQVIKKAVKKKPIETLKPKNGEVYWHINENNFVLEDIWRIDEQYDRTLFIANNVFKTEMGAKKECKKREAIMRVREWIANNLGVFEPDWEDGSEKKESIYWDNNSGRFLVERYGYIKTYSPIGHLRKGEVQKVIDVCSNNLKIIFDV